MRPLKLDLYPPREEERFEDLCRDLWSRIWCDRDARKHGRRGQEQYGVDVFGKSSDGWEGVQCKKKGRGKKLTEAEIHDEIEAAEGFPDGPLQKLILATTAPRDTDTQAIVRRLSDAHEKDGGFPVAVSGWEDILEELDQHDDLIQKYYSSPPADSFSISRLPVPGEHFLGRNAELRQLDEAWTDDDTNVFVLTAFGGVGKSALVYNWIESFRKDGWRGAERVLGWSFYSQGTDATAANADAFVDFALGWLGHQGEISNSPWERGVLLARLVRQKRTLLVLDGLEPLQHPPSAQTGRLKDPAVAALLRELAIQNNGLCVVTTRLAVADVHGRVGAVEVDLERLPSEAGAALLKKLGVEGTDRELKQASDDFGGHALALTLLGNYLTEALDGDIRQRGEVAILDEDIEQGGHARRVVASYSSWLGEGPELQVLRLMGLFDRPAEAEAVRALRKAPVVLGLTEGIGEGEEKRWRKALARLRKAGLLAPDDGGGLDAHPLVRAFFGESLEGERPEAWRAGHERLYEHYSQAAPELPDTLVEMMPLYVAVVHGCRAGRPQETLDEVYHKRINRLGEHYSWRKLGAFGAELTALAAFFDYPWDCPSAGLTAPAKAWILNEAAYVLRALGRLPEAVQPMRASLNGCLALDDWKEAAIRASNLSGLTLTLGDLRQAVASAEESVELADRSGDASMRIVNRTALADALHQVSRWEESGASFREAEAMQAGGSRSIRRFYSLAGYQYCDYLLSRSAASAGNAGVPPALRPQGTDHGRRQGQGEPQPDVEARPYFDGSSVERFQIRELATQTPGTLDLVPDAEACQDVLERAKLFFEWREPGDSLLSIALDHLSLGRAHLGLAQASGGTDTADAEEAARHLDRAVGVLRQAGHEWMTPHGLLARAVLRRFRGDLDGASADLYEAGEIAERGHMRLHECDVHLEGTRQCLVRGDVRGAGERLEKAREIVEATGYLRRERELELLTAVLTAALVDPAEPNS